MVVGRGCIIHTEGNIEDVPTVISKDFTEIQNLLQLAVA
jgi:hypothetical protein